MSFTQDAPPARVRRTAARPNAWRGALTLQKVAGQLGISVRQVLTEIDNGSLIAVDVGFGSPRRDLRVMPTDLRSFRERRAGT